MLIYPSIFEGFGIPILESLFSKTPVITSKGGCFSEVGGEHSKYIDPLSVDQMSKAILEIQNSISLRNSMIQKGFEHAQKFNDKKCKFRNCLHLDEPGCMLDKNWERYAYYRKYLLEDFNLDC